MASPSSPMAFAGHSPSASSSFSTPSRIEDDLIAIPPSSPRERESAHAHRLWKPIIDSPLPSSAGSTSSSELDHSYPVPFNPMASSRHEPAPSRPVVNHSGNLRGGNFRFDFGIEPSFGAPQPTTGVSPFSRPARARPVPIDPTLSRPDSAWSTSSNYGTTVNDDSDMEDDSPARRRYSPIHGSRAPAWPTSRYTWQNPASTTQDDRPRYRFLESNISPHPDMFLEDPSVTEDHRRNELHASVSSVAAARIPMRTAAIESPVDTTTARPLMHYHPPERRRRSEDDGESGDSRRPWQVSRQAALGIPPHQREIPPRLQQREVRPATLLRQSPPARNSPPASRSVSRLRLRMGAAAAARSPSPEGLDNFRPSIWDPPQQWGQASAAATAAGSQGPGQQASTTIIPPRSMFGDLETRPMSTRRAPFDFRDSASMTRRAQRLVEEMMRNPRPSVYETANELLRSERRRGHGSAAAAMQKVNCKPFSELAGEVDQCCAVCYDEYTPETLVATTPCKHMFHKSCLETWFETSVTCPMCRKAFRERDEVSGEDRRAAANAIRMQLMAEMAELESEGEIRGAVPTFLY